MWGANIVVWEVHSNAELLEWAYLGIMEVLYELFVNNVRVDIEELYWRPILCVFLYEL